MLAPKVISSLQKNTCLKEGIAVKMAVNIAHMDTIKKLVVLISPKNKLFIYI
jgi:hypothetical protein